MEKFNYPNSKTFLQSKSIKSKMMRYNRNNCSLMNLESGTNILKNSYISSPDSLKQSMEKKRYNNNINNSPVSTKTVNFNNDKNNNLKLKLFHENHINLHKKNLSSLNPLKDKLIKNV